MQAIERGGYSREEILDVLHSKHSARNVRFRYDLLDKDGVYKKTLETVLSGEVSMSAFSTIKRTAKFKVKERYIPEHFIRVTERNTDKSFDFNTEGTHNNTVVAGGTNLRITTPAASHIPDSNFNETPSTSWTDVTNYDGSVGKVHPQWEPWGSGRGDWLYTSAYAFNGQAQRMIRKASGSFGIQTKIGSSSNTIAVTAGQTLHLSFMFKPMNDPSGNFATPDYVYAMTTGISNDGYGNESFQDYTITDMGSGWYIWQGSLIASYSTNYGVLIGWNSTGADGEVIVDNVYFDAHFPPYYYGEWISPEVDVSDGRNATYVNSEIAYTIQEANGADIQIFSRVSLDGGSTWSAWSGEGQTAINGFATGDDLSNAKVQFKVTFQRYDPDKVDTYMTALSFWIDHEIDEFVPETTEINYLSDRIQPWMEIKMRDGNWIKFPLGVFLLSTPTRHDEVNGVYRDIEAYDGLVILDDDKFTSRYNIPAGTKYTKAVEDILSSAGITRFNIQDKGDALTNDKEFKIGTSKLEAVNELLSAINYTPIWVDARGYFTAYPYVSPADRRAEYTYADDELSVIYNGMEEELDLTEVANTWVVTQSNPEKTPLTSTKENTSEDSPTSTVNMGRTIVDFREIDDIADQATLDAYVERIAFEASQVFGKLKFKTALMPFHEYADVIHVKYDALKIDYKFSETNWTMKLEAGGEMEHEVRRVVNI